MLGHTPLFIFSTVNIFSSVQLLSHVWLFATPWTAAHQASLSISNSWSLLKLMSVESGMPSNHLILCHPLLLCLQSFPESGSFLMSQFFASGGQSIGDSASVLQWIFRTDFLQANKNIMIISLDKKKHLTKSHNKIPFIIKTLRKLKIEGNFLNLIRLIL